VNAEGRVLSPTSIQHLKLPTATTGGKGRVRYRSFFRGFAGRYRPERVRKYTYFSPPGTADFTAIVIIFAFEGAAPSRAARCVRGGRYIAARRVEGCGAPKPINAG
jgi:hypothetical protein